MRLSSTRLAALAATLCLALAPAFGEGEVAAPGAGAAAAVPAAASPGAAPEASPAPASAAEVAAPEAASVPMRSITTLELKTVASGDLEGQAESVIVVDLKGPLLLSYRQAYEKASGGDVHRFQPGLVAVFAPGLYAELVAGPLLDGEGEVGVDGFLEATYEFGKASAYARAKLRDWPSAGSYLTIASVGGSYDFLSWYTVRARFFYGWNEAGESSFSSVFTNEFAVGPAFGVQAGWELGYERLEASESLPWGVSLGLRYDLARGLRLKALGEYKADSGGLRSAGGSLVADWRF